MPHPINDIIIELYSLGSMAADWNWTGCRVPLRSAAVLLRLRMLTSCFAVRRSLLERGHPRVCVDMFGTTVLPVALTALARAKLA